MSRKPTILVVDDQESDFGSKPYFKSKNLGRVKTLHPRDVELKDLLWSNLVLVDLKLDSWSERDNLESLALKPKDGLALAAVLRRQVETHFRASPTAFAILTGRIRELAGALPPENRNHVLARINNLEWVFEKGKDISVQVSSLASAVEQLPNRWSVTGAFAKERLSELLNIKQSESIADQLLQDIDACLPPIHELSEWSHGLIIVRWLLHRILPYPCFLWDSYHVAARLRIEPDVFISSKNIRQRLKHCEYKGILADFLGTRWWRSSVELYLWNATNGKSSDIVEVEKLISGIAKSAVSRSVPIHPIICIDSDYRPMKKFSSLDDAVRVRPDDWPAYADHAWTTIELAKDEPRLRSLVIREDQPKLKNT